MATPERPAQLGGGFIDAGSGLCRDSSGSNPWTEMTRCAEIKECQYICESDSHCAGFAWAEQPDDDECSPQGSPRCVVYLDATSLATQTSPDNQQYHCYVQAFEKLDVRMVTNDGGGGFSDGWLLINGEWGFQSQYPNGWSSAK